MRISKDTPLLLGSASPRRRALLEGIGLPIHVQAAHVPELGRPGEGPEDFLGRIVADKLRGVAELSEAGPVAAVLVADTIVVIDDEILGKPENVADAARLVGRLAGRTHRVYTRYAIASGADRAAPVIERTVETLVTVRPQSAAQIERYAATGEGLDKAGAYAVQGRGAYLVERIEGSYTNVVGLPLCEVVRDLEEQGLLGPFP